MKVFISWADHRSRHAAAALHGWLPLVIQSAEPWMSAHGIGAGAQWFNEIMTQLEDPQTRIGVICLTPDNRDRPWLHFEAGALAKAVKHRTYVCPYLVGLAPTDVTGPLASFNAVSSDMDGTRKLVETINSVAQPPLAAPVLSRVFEKNWPDLEAQLKHAAVSTSDRRPQRTDRELLEEILELLRALRVPNPKDLRDVAQLLRHFC
jgi:hypothetical protein